MASRAFIVRRSPVAESSRLRAVVGTLAWLLLLPFASCTQLPSRPELPYEAAAPPGQDGRLDRLAGDRRRSIPVSLRSGSSWMVRRRSRPACKAHVPRSAASMYRHIYGMPT